MHLEQVDVVGPETPQAVFARLGDPARREAAALRVVAHRVPALGGEHHAIAPARDGATEDLLRHAVVVDVRGVEQGDAAVEREIHHAVAGSLVRIAPGAEHHRAERQGRGGESTVTQRSVLQRHSKPACCLNTRLSQ